MKRRNRGFTLVELLVVIGVIAVLIGLMMPMLIKARGSADRAKCLSNLHQIAVAYQMYLTEHKQRVMRVNPIPTDTALVSYTAPSLVEVLDPYMTKLPPRMTPTGVPAGGEAFHCPMDRLSAKDMDPAALSLPPGVHVLTYFDAEGSSYEYNFYFNASAVDPITGINRIWAQALANAQAPNEIMPLAPQQLPLVFDYETFHGTPKQMQARNAMFADFHAAVLDIKLPAGAH